MSEVWFISFVSGLCERETASYWRKLNHLIKTHDTTGKGGGGGEGGGGGGRCGGRGVRPALSLSAELLWMRHHYKLGETGRQEGGPEGGGGPGEVVRRRKEEEESEGGGELKDSDCRFVLKKSDGKKT